jgi:hypothetical protein
VIYGVLQIEHAPNHAGYDVFVNKELVGRIGYNMPDADAQDWLKTARDCGRPLNLAIVMGRQGDE